VLKNETVGDKLRIFHKEMYKYVDKHELELDLIGFRYKLIEEEYTETVEAIEDVTNKIVTRGHLLKELCDLVYVVAGTATELGMDFDTAFNRVHQNNMLKWQNPKFREDGKLMKAEGFETPNLEDLV